MQVSAITMVMHNGDGAPGAECSLLFPDWGLHYSYRNQQVRLFRFQHFDLLTISTSALVCWMPLSCKGNGLRLWWMVGEGKRKRLGRQDLGDSVLSLTKAVVRVTIGFPWYFDMYFGYPTSWSCSVAHLFVPMAALLDSSLILVRGRYMAREGQRPRQRSRQGSGQRPPTQSQGSTFPCQKRERRGCNICPQRAFSKKGMRRRSDHSGSQDILYWLGNTVEKYGWPSSTSIACSDEW